MEELKRVQELRIDESSRVRLIENQDTVNELTARIQELQTEVNCMNDSRVFKDAESVLSGLHHVTSQPALLPPHRDPGGMLSHSLGMPSRNERPPSIWDTHGISGNVFANPPASSSSRYQSLDFWRNGRHITACCEWTSKPRHNFGSEMPVRTVSQKFIRPGRGKIFKGWCGRPTKTADFGSSFWPIPYTNNICLLEDEIQNWGMYLFTISHGSFAVDQRTGDGWFSGWLKNLRVLSEGPGIPNFELLDARIALARNRIIQNTRFKKKVSLEEMKAHKEDRFLRGREIAYLIYDYFRVTGIHDSVENYADLFTISLRNDDIQEFDSKWDEILLSMTQIPSDDILESLYKLRIRESEKLKSVFELYNMEIHQKKAGPDYHRLKTMVKRSIEQNLRMKNFEARNGNFETSAVVKNPRMKQREHRSLGDCRQWKANGQCSKGDNCSFRHDVNKRAKSTQPNSSPR